MSGISSTDADSNHRKAYLWSLSDGTSAYYKVENSVGGSETKTLVLENADGTPAITYPIPAQLLTAPNQKIRIRIMFLPQGANTSARIFLYSDDSDLLGFSGLLSASRPTFEKLYVGSSRPHVENNIPRFDEQWGGAEPSDPALEPIDYVKIYVMTN